MKKLLIFSMLLVTLVCAIGYAHDRDRDSDSGQKALNRFYRAGPAISDAVNSAYGYAIFPHAVEAAFIVGGGGGKGYVYQGGQLVGTSKMSHVSVGFQIGGQGYEELIIFENARAFRRFTDGQLKFDAGAAAVVGLGAAAKIPYHDGVAVVILDSKGLMLKAAIGGQGFSYHPIGHPDED